MINSNEASSLAVLEVNTDSSVGVKKNKSPFVDNLDTFTISIVSDSITLKNYFKNIAENLLRITAARDINANFKICPALGMYIIRISTPISLRR